MAASCTRRSLGRPAAQQPRLADGSVDVRTLCAQLDAEANVGAGQARTEGER